MTDFKVGDRVVCIHAGVQGRTYLTQGNIYTIDYINMNKSIHVEGAPQPYSSYRFRSLTPLELLMEIVE